METGDFAKGDSAKERVPEGFSGEGILGRGVEKPGVLDENSGDSPVCFGCFLDFRQQRVLFLSGWKTT
jgi:hypothetical protein